MIIWFNNKFANINSLVPEEILDYKIPVISNLVQGVGSGLVQSSFENILTPTTPLVSSFVTSPPPPVSCSYPLRVEELFPYWLRNATENGVTQSNLVLMTKSYYDWLACGMTANDASFLNLEAFIDIKSIPENFIKNQLYTYINSFPQDGIQTDNNPTGIVAPDAARNLYDNVKVNLYTKKGTEESFKFVLESLFGIAADKVSISYPKRYTLRLNGGRYDWMRDDTKLRGQYSTNPASYNPQLTGSFLNYSVLQDSDLWQEHSYVLNISGLTAGVYQQVVRPLVHPAGTKDFYDLRNDVFNNISDSTSNLIAELPVIGNYAFYNLFSYQSLSGCCGCSGISGGTDPWPSHVFPNWDVEISTKYPVGITFGLINIIDFLKLNPGTGFTFPNETITCSSC